MTIYLRNIKQGMQFWYSTQQGNFQCLALEDACLTNGEFSVKVRMARYGVVNLFTDPYGREHTYEVPAYTGVRTEYLTESL